MVRSINITKTNEVVWGIVRDVYRQWHEKSRQFNETEAQGETRLDDSSGLHSQQFGWMSADQIDLMSDEHKRVLLSTLTPRISVRFDREFQRHCLEVEFREEISRDLGNMPGTDRSPAEQDGPARCGTLVRSDQAVSREQLACAGKKSRGSRVASAAGIEHSVTV